MALLWVDGRVPWWINVDVEDCDEDSTHLRLRCSSTLAPVESVLLLRDHPMAVDPDDPIEPFRIRGPGQPPEWRSVELDGPFSLRWERTAG